MGNRMARYDVRNDGIGPYAVFYCDSCSREYRTQPDVKATIQQDVGRSVLGGFLRNIPFVGGTVANMVEGQNPRYQYSMSEQQLDAAWNQVKDVFHECPACHQLVCNSDWDARSGFCVNDSPRKGEIAQAEAEHAVGAVKGIASAFGLGDALKSAGEAVKKAVSSAARCPKDGTLAAPGTKFCPDCGAEMIQPKVDLCAGCGAPTGGARFCPQCGAKVEAVAVPAICPKCGTDAGSAKFCPECGAKLA